MASYKAREEVKVVLVDTRYVETDPTSFKAVVQRLTGKDSCVAWIDKSSFSGQKRSRPVAVNGGADHVKYGGGGGCGGGGGADGGGGVLMLPNIVLPKDLEMDQWLINMEVSPMEELRW